MIADSLWDSVVLAIPCRARRGSSTIYDLKGVEIRLIPNGVVYPEIRNDSNNIDGVIHCSAGTGLETQPTNAINVFSGSYCLDFFASCKNTSSARCLTLYNDVGAEVLKIDTTINAITVSSASSTLFNLSGLRLDLRPHIAFSSDGTNTRIFVEGSLKGTIPYVTFQAVRLRCGASSFSGSFKNIRITNAARFVSEFSRPNHQMDLTINEDAFWDDVVLAATMDNWSQDPLYDKVIGYYRADNPAFPGLDSGPRGNHVSTAIPVNTSDPILGSGSWARGYGHTSQPISPNVPDMVFKSDFCIEFYFKLQQAVDPITSVGGYLHRPDLTIGQVTFSFNRFYFTMSEAGLTVDMPMPTDSQEPISLALQRSGTTLSALVNGVVVASNTFTDVLDFRNISLASYVYGNYYGVLLIDEVRYTAAVRYPDVYDHIDALYKPSSADDLKLNKNTIVGQADIFPSRKLTLGPDGRIDFDHKPELDLTSNFTIEGFFTPTQITGSDQYLVSAIDPEIQDSQFAISFKSNQISVHTSTDGTSISRFDYPALFAVGFRSNVSVCVSNTTMRVFVDGNLVGTETLALPLHSTNLPLTIGGGPASSMSMLDGWALTRAAKYTTNYAPKELVKYDGVLTGTVYSAGSETPGALVRVYRRDNGAFVAEGVTDSNGVFSIPAPLDVDLVSVALDPDAGIVYNDAIHGRGVRAT